MAARRWGRGFTPKSSRSRRRAWAWNLATVRVMPTRTDKVPNTSATAASAGTDLNGAAVLDACEQLKARLAPVAARLESELARVPNFREMVEAAYRERIALFAQGYYRTPGLSYDPRTGQGTPFHYFAYGAAVSEVEVDGFTGEYRLPADRHSARRRRFRLAGDRHGSSGRGLRAGPRLAHARRSWFGTRTAGWRPMARPLISCLRGPRCRRTSA